MDYEGLGLAHLEDIQEDAKTQTSFKYLCKCHISSGPALLVVLCHDHSTFKYHTPHEKIPEKIADSTFFITAFLTPVIYFYCPPGNKIL